jgi:hypothetical protein
MLPVAAVYIELGIEERHVNAVGPIRVEEIISAFRELGSECSVGAVKDRVILRRGGIPVQYKDEKTCRETIQRVIENHCPESDNYRSERPSYFQRLDRGVYKLLSESEWSNRAAPSRPHSKPKVVVSREKAKLAMSEYYKANKNALPPNISEKRDFIIQLLLEGVSVEEAFARACQ